GKNQPSSPLSARLALTRRPSLICIDVLFSQERTNYPVNVSVNDQGAAGFSLDIQVAEGIGAARVGEMILLALTALADALAQAPAQPVH
ncbi:hypothetical protein MRP09_21825, partial [Dickeya dianthicola]|uniref:hypothetical protein n=1 Tax=Dickeya dianthicola TaxID=204039 RepID=UPI001F6133A1